MAIVRKNGARTDIAGPATPFPGLKLSLDKSGLLFTLQIGFVKVEITHVERDMIIQKWAQLEKEFET